MEKDWKTELEVWLASFLKARRHKARARMCPAYVAGLIGPGDRKSVQPMAARDTDVSYDRLHHFISARTWNEARPSDCKGIEIKLWQAVSSS